MISGEDESSSVLNGRLRPRKSTANIPNHPNKSTHKTENKVAQDKLKRHSIPSKASPNKQDDLTSKAESSPPAQHLCPYCDKKFTTKISVSKHARRIHLSTSKQDNFIKCLFCNHSEAAPSEIIRHMVDSHPNQYFACLDCHTRFFSTSKLAEHKLSVCEKHKQAYRSKLRQKTSSVSKKDQKKMRAEDTQYSRETRELKHEPEFNSLVISCELKPSHTNDPIDIEDNITTNLILPSNLGNTVLDKNAVIILDDIQWNRRIPANFSFRNADADQILSRLGVVHRSPRVGETTRREWLKMIDVTSQKFEKCFDTHFYSRVASNVQQNLARFLDGTFNFSPDPDKVIKTRKTKSSAVINTAEGFPILLPHEQYSRNRFDGYMPRALAPKHKWKWDSTENEKNIIFDANVVKRDNHVDNCIITLVSSLDIWTQLRMRSRFEGIFCKAAIEKFEKQNIIGRELKEILESREIPCSSSHVVDYPHTSSAVARTTVLKGSSEFPSFLGLAPRVSSNEGPVQPAVLSGEWVRPRCYVCCACGDQTSDARALTAHMASHHPNAQVQHYEIVGESLLNADILKHLYVPPSQMSNRTRPIRGFRDCTKCKKSVTVEDLHQHMLDCAGDTPAVRRKCRSRPFGVRRRRPRLPDNVIRKKMRKDLRTRHNAKALLRTRPRIRSEVGDAETIRKMIAGLPEKRHRQASGNLNNTLILRPRRKLDKQRSKLKIKRLASKDSKTRKLETKNELDDSSVIDEDDQPLKPKTKVDPKLKTVPTKTRVSCRVLSLKCKKTTEDVHSLNEKQQNPSDIANNIEPQQISSENCTERLNINSRGNGTGGEENRDATDKNENGGERKKSPDRERDKNVDKNIDSDPALLKHSISNITSSSNDKSQLQQIRSSQQKPDKSDEDKYLQDTRNTFLKNDIGPALPDKPPLQLHLKRSSQKKRESLLNCIEKIKSQQKGETMSDQRQAERSNRPTIEIPQLPLLDPHPAVISRSCDESGAAKNVMPLRRTDLHSDIAGQLPRINESISNPWNSGLETINQTNTPVVAPAVQSYSVQSRSLDAKGDIISLTKKSLTEVMNQKLTSAQLVPTEHFKQLAQLFFQQQQRSHRHASSLQNDHEEQADHRMSFSELLIQQQLASRAFQNELNRSKGLVPVQYTSDLHFEGNKYQLPLRNDAASLSIVRHQNPNISHSPQWNRDALQMQHINSSISFPRMISSLMTKEFLNPASAQRSPLKRTSESSESDVNSNRNMDDADFLNFAHMRRLSSETAVLPYVPPSPHQLGSKDTTPYYRSQIHHDVALNKDAKSQENKTKNRNAYGDSTFNTADYYRQQSQATLNNQFYALRPTEEHILSKMRAETDPGFSHTDNHDDNLQSKRFYLNNSDKIIAQAQKRYMDGNPHNLMSTPIENRMLEQTSLIKDITSRPIDMKVRDNAENLTIERKIYEHQKHKLYADAADHVNTQDIHVDSDSLEEPLDLSGKHGSACCNDNANIDEERDEMTYATLDLSKPSSKDTNKMSVNIYTKPSTSSEDRNISSDKYGNSQHTVPFPDQIPAINKPMLASDGMLPYYRKNNDHESSTVCNTKLPESFSKQFSSQEKELRNVNSNNESAFLTAENIEKNYLGTQVPIICTSPNTNFVVTLNEQVDKNNEKFTPTPENPIMFLQSEVIHDNNMPSCSKSQQLTTELEQPENLITAENMKLNTSSSEVIPTQPKDENTRDNKSTSEPTASTSAENDNENETAKKVALFPPELVDLLNVVPKEQHNKFVSVISQLIPANNEGPKPAEGAEPQVEPQQAEVVNVVNVNAPVEESTVKIENRLSINTAALPSSSILPKKRHSPSVRLTSQDNSNVRPTHISPTVNPLPNNNTKNYESERKEKPCDQAFSNIDKVIDLTDDDHDDTLLMPSTPITKNVIPESVTQTALRSFNEPSRLRSVRIKPLISKQSTSDDKQLTITNSQQPIGIDLKEKNVIANVVSHHKENSCKKDNEEIKCSAHTLNTALNQAETNYTTQDSMKNVNTPIFNHDQMKQSLTNDFVINEIDEKIEPLIGNTQKQQIIAAPAFKITENYDRRNSKNEDHLVEAANNNTRNISNSSNEEDPALVTESLTSITSDQNLNTIDQTSTNSQDEKLLQNNVTGVCSKPDVQKHADIIEEESDDDVSLAVIFKQKSQENTFSENEDSTSDSDTSDFLIQLQKEKIKAKTKKTSKRLHSKDSQQINDAIESQHNLLESENGKKEIDRIKEDNSCCYLNKNITAPVFTESQNKSETESVKSYELLSSHSNINEIDVKIQRIPSQKSHQNNIKNNNFPNYDYPISINENKDTATVQQPLQQEYPVSSPKITEILETNSMMDGNISAEAEEPTERALRRSRREKSLLLNHQNLVISKKKSATKKQMVLSKLLDENTPFKYGRSKTKGEKLRKSPAQTKSTKRSCNSDYGFTDINEFDYEKIEKPTETIMTNTHSSDAGCFEFNKATESNSHPQKRKSVSFDTPNKKNAKNAKSNDNGSMLDLNINVCSNSLKTGESTQVKLNEHDNFDYQIATLAYKNIKKQPEKMGTEMRTACYNRPIPSQQISLTCVFDKNPVNYDPYDIDLDIDMVDMSRPILKRKRNKSVSGKKTKKSVEFENSSDNIQQKIETEMPKIAIPDSSPPCVSDSDSSISDVPLQKYVEEKAKMKIESLQSSCNKSENNNGPNYTLGEETTNSIELPCQSVRQSSFEIKHDDTFEESELKHTDDVASLSNTTNDAAVTFGATDGNKNNVNHLNDIDYSHGVDLIEPSTKQSTTQKRNRRPKVSKKSDASNDYNHQLLSDMSMNNLEMFTYKTPRKSNLMASKKISETFNKLESEEAYYRPSPKHRQKKSQSEKRSATKEHTSKTRDIIENINRTSSLVESTALPDSESLRVSSVIEERRPKKPLNGEKRSSTKESPKTRDSVINSSEVSSPVQSIQVAKNSTSDEACVSNDGEVDLITAQKMLESEEIRKLERDLYFGFKKAAEANAGKTSGFNQLRAEETSQSASYEQYVSSPIADYVGADPNNSRERIESPVRSESPARSESPESLKDKPLMYPEEEVNIYEDKYDIIKRRREANANVKQFQKVNKPTKCKSGRVKKKTEKKNTKKTTKKIQQASQVPTKAALKNFESIKISIPTQDLHMPPNLSPPHRQKRSKSLKNKQPSAKTRNDSVSSHKSDNNPKADVCTDIYEFQDDERPVLKGYKETRVIDDYKSSSSDNESIGTKVLPKGKQNKERNNVASRAIKKDQPEKTIKKKGRGKRKGKTQGRKKTDKNGKPKGIIQVRFVPDNNEVSSYESDALPPSPADTTVEDVLECTCSTEKDSGDLGKETEDLEKEHNVTGNHEKSTEGRKTFKGCNSIHCRYKNDNMKNTALENIFRSSCKSEDKENKLNKLFDSLLGINKTSAKVESPDHNSKSTSYLKTDLKSSVDTLESKSKSICKKSCVDDGFSSLDHRDSENENLNLLETNSQDLSIEMNLLSKGEDALNSSEPAFEAEYSNDQIEMEEKELDTSNNFYNNNHNSSDYCLSSSAYVGKKLKSGNTRLKHKRGESEDRSKATKRSSSLLDKELSLSENESSPATKSTKNRVKKTAQKPKNNKAIRKSDVPDKRPKTSKATTKLKCTQTSRKTEQEHDAKGEEKVLDEKLSPSRKSDEGISTSYDNRADANEIALDTGVALQRARRKCTVGKQNVLVEHWSSSESEEEPSRNKGKKSTAAKKCSRSVRKLSSNRRSREEAVEEESRALVLKSCELAIPEPDLEPEPVSDESDAERDPKDKSEQELHGWIVGRSHKKLVTMLVCSKRKSSPDDDDDDDEKVKAIEDAKEEEINEEEKTEINVEQEKYDEAMKDEDEEDEEDDENMEIEEGENEKD